MRRRKSGCNTAGLILTLTGGIIVVGFLLSSGFLWLVFGLCLIAAGICAMGV